ncbi:MAG: glycosyltransferase family 2 protein [Candidatus Nanogingivalis sp.]
MNNPLVSIIVPVYNTKKEYMEKCFNSIFSQDYKNIEVIIVDDGSNIDTSNYLQLCCRKNNWKLIRQNNAGLSSARNNGFNNSKGKYIQFLDSDDLFDKSLISKAVINAESNSSDIVVENFSVIDDNTGELINKDILSTRDLPQNRFFQWSDIEGNKFESISYNVWSKMFKKSFLTDHEIMHDENLFRAEDVLFTYSAISMADKISVLNEPLITYRENISTSNSSSNEKYPIDSVVSWFKLYQYLSERNIYLKYRVDFEHAMIGSIFWHFLKISDEKSKTKLSDAAIKFMSKINFSFTEYESYKTLMRHRSLKYTIKQKITKVLKN